MIRKKELGFAAAASLAVAGVVILLLAETLRSGFPANLEPSTTGDYFSKIALINHHGWWTPNWYLGFDIDKWYPPLTTILTLGLGRILGDYSLAYNCLAFTGYMSLSLGLFFWLRQELGTIGALIATGMFISAHVVVVSFQGLYWETPRLLGLACIPWTMVALRRTAKTGSYPAAAFVGVGLGITVLFSLIALLEAFAISTAYILVLCLPGRDVKYANLWRFTFSGMVTLGVCAWWLIPALSSGVAPLLQSQLSPFSPRNLVQIYGSPGNYAPFVLSMPSPLGAVLIASSVWAIFRLIQTRRGTMTTFSLALGGIFLLFIAEGIPLAGRFGIGIALALAVLTGCAYQEFRNRWVKVLFATVCFVLMTMSVMHDNADIRVDNHSYQSSSYYQNIIRIGDVMQGGDRVYIMWSKKLHVSDWFNVFLPDRAQVLGGNDQAPVVSDVRRIDFLAKQASSTDINELFTLLEKNGITYLAVDPAETSGLLLDRYTPVYQGEPLTILRTGYKLESPPAAHAYWDSWRIVGLIISVAFTVGAIGFKYWSQYEDRIETEEMRSQNWV